MEVNIKVLKGKLFLRTNNGIIPVKAYTKTHLVKHTGYYDKDAVNTGIDPFIYIFRGKKGKHDIPIPGSIYIDKNGDHIWVEHDDDKKSEYLLSNCVDLSSLNKINEVISSPYTKFQEIAPEIMDGMNGEVFAPPIRDTDDFLKRIIKLTLQKMQINPITLKSKFSNDYDLNNMKSQLIKEGAMSSKYFQRWAEVLDINIEVIVTNRDGSNKLKDEVTLIMK